MDTKIIILKLSKFTMIFLLCLVLLGLLFRVTVYWKLAVVPGEPIGLGDLIELFLYLLILSVAGLLVFLSALVAGSKNYTTATKLFLAAVLSPVAYFLLYSLLARLM